MDTVHLYYKGLATKMADSTEAKITAWAKNLKGQHTNVHVIAWYFESEFKKYSVERADEMFIMLNRKARDLMTLGPIETKKGKKSQRSTVDIIYSRPSGSSSESGSSENTSAGGSSSSSSSGSTSKGAASGSSASSASSGASTAPKAFAFKDQFKARKLMVVLLEENPVELDKIDLKFEEQGAYRGNIKTHNDNITKAFKTFWKATPVDFIKESELEAGSLDEKAANWIILLPGKAQIGNAPFMTYNANMVYKDGSVKVSNAVFKISLHSEMPDESDFLVLMNKLKVYYGLEKEFALDQLEETLTKKTLYMDISTSDIPKEEFRESYPYPVEFKTAEEILEKTRAGAKDIVYIKTDAQYGNLNATLVDAETGATLARSPMMGISGPSESRNFAVQNELSGDDSVKYKRCNECAIPGAALINNYKEKAKVNKATMRDLGSEKKQMKNSVPLTVY